jgi:hypothetical protein
MESGVGFYASSTITFATDWGEVAKRAAKRAELRNRVSPLIARSWERPLSVGSGAQATWVASVASQVPRAGEPDERHSGFRLSENLVDRVSLRAARSVVLFNHHWPSGMPTYEPRFSGYAPVTARTCVKTLQRTMLLCGGQK